MDAKDLRTESAVTTERNNDGSKYSQSGGIGLHCDRNKSYQDIGSNSLGKVDGPNARPCAVIGPDRVVPPPATNEAYHIKKGPAEPWPCMDNAYRRPPDYPHKLSNYQNPTRNISPRQTFQENMQRIMVPPTYNAIKPNEDTNYAQLSDRNSVSKNIKLNMPPEAKFCDVPYAVNPSNNEHKNIRNPEMCLPSVNPTHTRTAPLGWPSGSINLRSSRLYGAPELYQYQDYPSCAGPRPVVPRPHRTVPEEGFVYADPYYQEGNIRFKPYPNIKERYPQQRYEYISNYSNAFHPPPGFPSHKYEVPKSIQTHPYPPYPPIKYLDSRIIEPVMEGYQRNPQGVGPNLNIQYRSQVIHPNFGPVVGSSPQNKIHSYPPDAHMKAIPPNKLSYDNNTKTYIEYENSRPKIYPSSESYYLNEMARIPMKSQVIMPNYSTLNMHNIPPNPYYKKDTQPLKNYDHMAHLRNIDPNLNIHNPMTRHAPVFSPNTLAISPTDSNTSNDTTQTLGTSQEDCGYVSQSSTASVRSIDSAINRVPNEYIRKYYDNRYGPIVSRTLPAMSTSQLNSNNNSSKDKKQIDVRQFFQMWNEGDEEQEENGSKEKVIQTGSTDKINFAKSHSHEAMNSQEQLYVLGLVNVPSEELAKYEHIQKVSKLPENIKGYNSIELLNQFEEVIESSHMNNYKTPAPKESMYHSNMSMKGAHSKLALGVMPPRPVSPLDVEAKISQSVIHKEVGCNFEIKPCSPKMLNVEVAAPIQNILAERSIEKVANPVMLKSPMLNGMKENNDCNMIKRTDFRMNVNENLRISSCKMIKTQFSNSNTNDPVKSSYSIQDLESNSGLCLASLPRLDNDIELNFPEVNQQFINANKGDNTVLTTSIRDLPTLEVLDQSPNQIKDKFNNTNPLRPEKDIDRSPYIVDSEKEFSKLSKYRKSKSNSFESKETRMQHNINAFRTDSVIIKNPENVKNHEENADLNKMIMDIQQAPINLTSQASLSGNIESQPDNIDYMLDTTKEKQLPDELAIDFSLNKTGILDNSDYMEPKIESQINTSMDVKENPLNNLNKDDSSDSVSLLPEYNAENFNNDDNIDGNCSLDRKRDSIEESKTITEINEKCDEGDFKQNLRVNERNLKIGIEINKCSSNSEEKMIVDATTALSPSNTEIPDENFVSDNNCEIDIDSSEDITDESTEIVNCTSTETAHDPTESFEEKYEIDTTENTTNVAIDKNFADSQTSVNNLNSLVQTETKLENDTSDINYPSRMSSTVVTEQTQPCNTNNNKLLITRDETGRNDCGSSYLNQAQNTNSKSHFNLKGNVIDHNIIIKDNTDDSMTQTSEKFSNQEIQLMNFDEGTQSSLENAVHSDVVQSIDEDSELEEPFLRNLWYGSKELYSPWIQKLLTFSEGSCNSAPTNNNKDSNKDVLVDTTETVMSVTEINDDHEGFDRDLKVHIEVPLEQAFLENEIEDMSKKLDNSKDTAKDTVDTLSSHILDNNIDETLNSEDGVEYEDSNINESNSNKELLAVDEVNNMEVDNVDVGTLLVNCKVNESNVINCEDSYINKSNYNKENELAMDVVNNIEVDNVDVSTALVDCEVNESNVIECKESNIIAANDDKENALAVIEVHNIDVDNVDVSTALVNCEVNESNVIECKESNIIEANDDKENELAVIEVHNIDVDNVDVSTALVNCEVNESNVIECKESNIIEANDKENELAVVEVHNIDVDNVNVNTALVNCEVNDTNVIECKESNIIEANDNEEHELAVVEVHNIDVDNVDVNTALVNCEVNETNVNESKESNIIEANDNEENELAVVEVHNINVDNVDVGTLLINCEVNETNVIECENSNINEANDSIENENTVVEVDNVDVSTPLINYDETNVTDLPLENEPNCNKNTQIITESQGNSAFETQCEIPDTASNIENLCESVQEETEHFVEQHKDRHIEPESSVHYEHVPISFNEVLANDGSYKKCQRLKRSLSDSALNMYNNDERQKQDNDENVQCIWPYKRRKVNNVKVDNDLLAQKLCNIIHNNRRNSVSSFYNEDVSFCILIDDSCIITEEENEESEKVCYTELSEECLAEIQSNCTNHDEDVETLTEVASSPQQENACNYSDSVVLDCEEDKTLEESWDEDVECVETVISDDIAADIEICGISSPKDDALSDNDESGVFSSSEHTDKVKFIYGDKMCSDDALFVETLFKTPQMDVNKTLYNRETRVSEECERYYDNDSLEKMLSESIEQPLSLYVPQYMETMFPSGKIISKETEKKENIDTEAFHTFQGKENALDIVLDINAEKVSSKETPGNKEKMDIETFHPFQSNGNALDIVVDINVDKNERENTHSIEIFTKSRDDTVRSYESSVDNVFTYNQKDDDAIYTSSSPEVSSTTSEEKGSGILLKITNYKGSRISQVNDISRVTERSSCKFTEEKEYLHSHANYSSNRPLLTKAAQKYIPPLKESIRDLKVKLTLPQHSLMKLKQLKMSKDEPKVNKQTAAIPLIPKKPKPKFEDVLKSIDEIQFKNHKEKTKKTKKSIPKVVIKKTQNGSHYASTSNKDFNPDLTGRKWQPWVFIEKNHFIDKMATRKKTKAIYSHRKRTYVLAEKFQKYKSASSTKFVISPPVSDNPSSGLKYTIRLKHNY